MERRNFLTITTATAATAALNALGISPAFALNEKETIPKGESKVSLSAKDLNPNTKWLREAGWGLFSHYLVHMPSAPVPENMTGELWNKKVNSFNAAKLASQLSELGAAYYFITIGQGGGYFCSPNKTYEGIFGPSHGKLSDRDLIADLAVELSKKDIRLCAYLPAFGNNEPKDQSAWLAVITEWSQRWGNAISAWWIDGKYNNEAEYSAFTKAFKSGNANSIIAYNTGPIGMNRDQLLPATPSEDFLAGEVDYFLPTCGIRVFDQKEYYLGPNISGDQLHFLNFLGAWWGTGEPRFSDAMIKSWTDHVIGHGGAVTWDVPVSDEGVIPDAYVKQLAVLKTAASISFLQLLEEMTDAASLARWPAIEWQNKQSSALQTSDRHNPGQFGNKAIGNFIRIEDKGNGQKEWVLMEHEGAGAIVRMWAPNMAKDAIFRVYIDGKKNPAIEVNMMKFFYGEDFVKPPFAAIRARGGNVYLPVPFGKSCKVTVDKNVCGWAEPADLFYIIQYRAYNAGTRVESFSIDHFNAAEQHVKKAASALTASYNIPAVKGFSNTKKIYPHDALVLDLPTGSNAIKYLSVKLDAKNIGSALRSMMLSISFDGKETVLCPVGDFFGSGSGLNPFSDRMRAVQKNGLLYCRWMMPYEKSAQIKVISAGKESVVVTVSANTDLWKWDDRSMYFHSSWHMDQRISNLPTPNFNFIHVKGCGVYVGDTLNITSDSPRWWGEGPEKISIDGEEFPSQFGTGSEDYYGYAWGDRTIFDGPFGAQPRLPEGPEFTGTTVNSRIRLLDAIPFKSELKLDMEVLTQGTFVKEATKLDYGVAVYWYAKL